jgi:hypothetical protein
MDDLYYDINKEIERIEQELELYKIISKIYNKIQLGVFLEELRHENLL